MENNEMLHDVTKTKEASNLIQETLIMNKVHIFAALPALLLIASGIINEFHSETLESKSIEFFKDSIKDLRKKKKEE